MDDLSEMEGSGNHTAETIVVDDDFHVGEISSLSDGQEKALSILPLTSGTLSVLGCSHIIYHVLKSTRHKSTPYGRIMLGLSICVLVMSLNLMIAPFLLPADSSQRVWASGNHGTCAMVGFITQFAFSACCYNGFLSFYYWLTIRHGMPQPVFAKRYEPYLHAFCTLFFLATASLGVLVGIFSESEIGLGCWIGEYPAGCERDGNCIGHIFGWIFVVPCMVFFVSIPLMNLSIYWHVRSTLQNNEKYSHDQSTLAERRRSQMKHLKDVAMQGSLYVASFYLSYTMIFVERVLEGIGVDANKEADIFWVLVLRAFLTPLQGFLLSIIFSRPNYVLLRNSLPEKSRLWALKKVLSEPDTSKFIRAYNSTTASATMRAYALQKEPQQSNEQIGWISGEEKHEELPFGKSHELDPRDDEVKTELDPEIGVRMQQPSQSSECSFYSESAEENHTSEGGESDVEEHPPESDKDGSMRMANLGDNAKLEGTETGGSNTALDLSDSAH